MQLITNANDFGYIQIIFYIVVLVALVKPLGTYMARVFSGEAIFMGRLLGPVERAAYRLAGVRSDDEMGWKRYTLALLLFSAIGLLVVFLIQRAQGWLPLNPDGLGAVRSDTALNTAISFVSNTNWQSYSGETTMSYLTQMVALTVQNFVSAATGLAVLIALIRGIVRHTAATIGNFWVDLVRGTLYILLPLSLILALLLVGQGVVQTFAPADEVALLQPIASDDGLVTTQTIAMGPAASQIAIKQLGTNGGGFFNVNSAHPFENPTPFSNFLEMLAILLIPAALCYTFGKMVKDTRQGWALLIAMFLLFVPLLGLTVYQEQAGTPVLADAGADLHASALQSGGNMEGKETRFGIDNSALWATATTAASSGSVNTMHDSLTPLGGLAPLFLMQLGEVVFGGAGSGLYGMLAFALIAVFVAGLMVGRTPEYLGKKIEAFDIKMVSLVILVSPVVVLLGTAIAVVLPAGVGTLYDPSAASATIFNPGAQGFSEVLYAFTSAGNNNGSAFAGLGANTPFYNIALGIAMLAGRFLIIVPILALAGSLAGKKVIPASTGTLPTHTPLFVALLVGVVLIVGALTYLPALALGPIVEQIVMLQ